MTFLVWLQDFDSLVVTVQNLMVRFCTVLCILNLIFKFAYSLWLPEDFKDILDMAVSYQIRISDPRSLWSYSSSIPLFDVILSEWYQIPDLEPDYSNEIHLLCFNLLIHVGCLKNVTNVIRVQRKSVLQPAIQASCR